MESTAPSFSHDDFSERHTESEAVPPWAKPPAPTLHMPPRHLSQSLALEMLNAHRLARIAFGAVLLVGATGFGLSVVASIFDAVDKGAILQAFGFDSSPSTQSRTGFGQTLLAGTWLAAIAVWGVARLSLPTLLRRRGPAGGSAAGGERGSVGFFESRGRSFRASEKWALPSLMLPLMGLSLLIPLSLHGLIFAVMGTDYGMSFDRWAGLSFVLVGHAHLALIWLVARDAKRLLNPSPAKKVQARTTLLWVSLVAVFPGGIFYLLPPFLTLVTGAAFIPLLYAGARVLALRDRALIRAAI